MQIRYRHKTDLTETIIFLGFALFSLFGILRHEMWRDELQAWMLARHSGSIFELIQNMQYEGHPALWHLCLYALSQITHNPLIMQLFHWGIALGSVYLVVRYSPFSIIHKFLLSLSYFIFYEYVVISRSYGLTVLLSFLFCTIYNRFRKQYLILSLLLALMANANAYGFLLSITLVFFIILEELIEASKTKRKNPLGRPASLILLSGGWLISAWQIARVKLPILANQTWLDQLKITSTNHLPVTSEFVNTNLIDYEDVIRLGNTITSIWKSYVPIPPLFQLNFWNRNILTNNVFLDSFSISLLEELIAIIFSIILFSLAAYFFSRKPAVLGTYIFGTLIIFLFQFFIHQNTILRHDGYFFIVFILCAWLYKRSNLPEDQHISRPPRKKSPLFSLFLSVLLSAQAFAGIHAMGIEYVHSFSSGKAAAEFIRTHSLTDLLIAGDHFAYTSVISGYLDMPIYYLDSQTLGTFWTKTPSKFVDNTALFQSIEAKVEADQIHAMVLVLTQPMTTFELENAIDMQFKQLATFDQSIVPQENFYLYLAQKDD